MVDDTVLAHDLGVLVVHGIGERKKRGETLTQWADALSSWLTEWSSHDDRSTVSEVVLTRASLSPERGIPANATLSLAFEAEAQANQQWLIAEGWWAGAFEPPRFFELWSWSFKSVPATAAMHANALMGTAIRRRRLEQGWARLVADARIVGLVFILVLLVLLSPVILLLLTALLIVGIVASALPILSLREAVTKAQLVAVGTIGDSQRLVESPTQAAAIKAPIVDGLTGSAPRVVPALRCSPTAKEQRSRTRRWSIWPMSTTARSTGSTRSSPSVRVSRRSMRSNTSARNEGSRTSGRPP